MLYSLLRMHEGQPGAKVGVITILSDLTLDMARDLSPQVQSVFLPEEIVFPQYSYEEIKDILKYRVRFGFMQGVISDELIEMIAKYTEDTGDLRVGINMLKRAGLNAERRASRDDIDGRRRESLRRLPVHSPELLAQEPQEGGESPPEVHRGLGQGRDDVRGAVRLLQG